MFKLPRKLLVHSVLVGVVSDSRGHAKGTFSLGDKKELGDVFAPLAPRPRDPVFKRVHFRWCDKL